DAVTETGRRNQLASASVLHSRTASRAAPGEPGRKESFTMLEFILHLVVSALLLIVVAKIVDGVVSSVNECRAVKLACGPDFLVVTPGIRLAGEAVQDQKRVATPAVARAAGADFLVVGRSITRAEDPAAALERIRAELG
ncbi:MAG: orotidine 5'-phosphate decarboxylase, partial [Gemmatimonadetes bacterium]|nr:orotidine 5'-phosphate decarboxylase [Gemmatimonadota bacterium]